MRKCKPAFIPHIPYRDWPNCDPGREFEVDFATMQYRGELSATQQQVYCCNCGKRGIAQVYPNGVKIVIHRALYRKDGSGKVLEQCVYR